MKMMLAMITIIYNYDDVGDDNYGDDGDGGTRGVELSCSCH